jgi:Gamma tubulin complex component N-terminal
MIVSEIRSDKTRGPTVATFCSVVAKYLRNKFYPALEELDAMEAENLLTLQQQCIELDKMLEPLKELAREILECDMVGGELLNYLYSSSEKDQYTNVAEMLKQMFALVLKRYYDTLYEWLAHGSLTIDLTHEVRV